MPVSFSPFQAWIADLRTDSGLARHIGFYLSWTAANFAGPIFSGFLFGLYPRLPFFLAAILSSTLFFPYAVSSDKERQPVEAAATGADTIRSVEWPDEVLLAVWVANFASWLSLAMLGTNSPNSPGRWTLPPLSIGLLMGGIGFSLFMGFLILRQNVDWDFRRPLPAGISASRRVRALLFVVSSQPMLFALALIPDRDGVQRHPLFEPGSTRSISLRKKGGGLGCTSPSWEAAPC